MTEIWKWGCIAVARSKDIYTNNSEKRSLKPVDVLCSLSELSSKYTTSMQAWFKLAEFSMTSNLFRVNKKSYKGLHSIFSNSVHGLKIKNFKC